MAQIEIDSTGDKVRHRHPFADWEEVFIPPGVVADEEKMLLAVNDLLTKKRHFALDHEREGEVFLTAALVKTTQGNFFIKPNIQLPNTPVSRTCGEAGAVGDAVEMEGYNNMEVADLWFTGGRGIMKTPGTLEGGVPVIPEDHGSRNVPCGSCLDVIWNNRRNRIPGIAGPETQVHILPLNDGDLSRWGGKLIPYDPDATELAPNQVLTKPISQLLPHVTYSLEDPCGKLKEVMKAGWDMLQEPTTRKAFHNALEQVKKIWKRDSLVKLRNLEGKPENEIKKAINDIMVDTMHGLVERLSVPLENARVVVIRTDEGEFFLGKSFKNSKASAMQFAEFDAIDEMLNSTKTGTRVTDVFIYAVDFDKAQKTAKEWQDNAEADVTIAMPDGAARRRISAVSPNKINTEFTDISGEKVNKETGSNIHIILPNNKKDFNPKNHIVSMPLSDLLPYRWTSPTMIAHAEHGEQKNPGDGKDLSDDYIVFVPTSTPEKVALYQHAADVAGWPIHFRKMQDLVEAFHIIDEVKNDYAGNAEEKLAEARKIIEDFHNGKAPQLVDLCENKWGIKFNPDHILFAADDSGMDGPPGAWEKMNQAGVDQRTRDKITNYIAEAPANGNESPRGGAGTELSPVMSAMLGQTEYMRRMVEAIFSTPELNPEVTGVPLKFIEHSTLSALKLSKDKEEEPIAFTTPLVFTPPARPNTDIKTCWHYLEPETLREDRPEDKGRTAAELGFDYVAHYSPKRQIVDHLATKILGLTEADKNKYAGRDKADYKDNRRNLASLEEPFKVACVDFDPEALGKSKLGTEFNFSREQRGKDSAHDALSVVETLMKNNDAFVLRPDHGLEDADRYRKYYTLFSMVVAKLLVGRDMNKPIIIQNHNGCWDDAVNMHQYLVKKSMTRDFNFTPKREGLPEDDKTTLFTNGFFDVISSKDLKAVDDRSEELLDWHRQHYEKRHPVNGEPQSLPAKGKKAPEDLYKVAVFLSAGNENVDLNNDTREFCKNLALKGYGMVTGGGDRYAMGAAYEGYHEGQREIKSAKRNTPTWSGAFSTKIILDAETKEGKFAEGFDYSKCCANIYERMAGMLENSDTVVIRAGGAGTMEEWMAFLVLKQQFPDQMADKRIIIYDPNVFETDDKPYYTPILEAVLGKHFDAIMGHDGKTEEARSQNQRRANEQMGIYVVDNDQKIMELIDRFSYAKQPDNWKGISSASSDIYEHIQQAQKPGFASREKKRQADQSPYLGLSDDHTHKPGNNHLFRG